MLKVIEDIVGTDPLEFMIIFGNKPFTMGIYDKQLKDIGVTNNSRVVMAARLRGGSEFNVKILLPSGGSE